MDLLETIQSLEELIGNPVEGLPEDAFLLVSRITPLVNVDLLIKNDQKHTLLTWRNDGVFPAGWHIPGGIVRYKEPIASRIIAVAASELGAAIEFKKVPLAINEVIHPSRRVRGHFISFLYECTLVGALDENLRYRNGMPRHGEWAWHKECPANILAVHEMYRHFISQDSHL